MSETNVNHPFPGLIHRHEPNVDVITWSNKDTPKNTPLYLAFIATLIIVVPLAVFLTIRLVNDVGLSSNVMLTTGELLFSAFIVLVSWGAVAGISYYLMRLSWTETIKISDDEIRLLYSGPLAPKGKRFSANQIYRLSFEKVGNERDRETRFTLNIFNLDDKRETLAYWIRAEENYRLFLLLDKIFSERGWSVQSKSDFKKNVPTNPR